MILVHLKEFTHLSHFQVASPSLIMRHQSLVAFEYLLLHSSAAPSSSLPVNSILSYTQIRILMMNCELLVLVQFRLAPNVINWGAPIKVLGPPLELQNADPLVTPIAK